MFQKKKKDINRIVANVQLVLTPEQHGMLLDTTKICNAAANWFAQELFDVQCADPAVAQKHFYHDIREEFDLLSTLTQLVMSKALGAYKRDLSICPTFKLLGSISYDHRTYKMYDDKLSISTNEGRLNGIPLKMGPSAKHWLSIGKWKEADLILRKNKFYLAITVELPKPASITPSSTLGVDLGIVNIATDSDGSVYSGAKCEEVRQWYAKRRAALQSKGTRSAKRRLKKLSGGEARFKKNENHIISKKIVASAQGTGRRIALEDLTHIRSRVTVRHTQRAKHSSWAFWQLRHNITYKAALVGIPVIIVDPRGTSTTCFECEYWNRKNRKSQSEFCCLNCGHCSNADLNASKNIAQRADLNQPMVSSHDRGKRRAT